jgi:polar amino acid transport system substrate-binding protein
VAPSKVFLAIPAVDILDEGNNVALLMTMRSYKFILLWAISVFLLFAVGCQRQARVRDWEEIRASGVIRWGSDEAGGAPFEFRNPQNTEERIGFEVEIADELARRLGVKLEFVQVDWAMLLSALERGDCDFVMSGIEITEDRKQVVDFCNPYYVYSQQLVVRADDTQTSSLQDLVGKRVGTLNNTAAERILKATPGIEVVSYDDNVRPYDDLAIGRLDGVLLDYPIALYYAKPNPKLRFAGEPFGDGFYGIAVSKSSPKLRDELDRVLAEMRRDGTLERILKKWGLWNDKQRTLFGEVEKK